MTKDDLKNCINTDLSIFMMNVEQFHQQIEKSGKYILITQFDGIGDAVCISAMIRELHKSYPSHKIIIVCYEANESGKSAGVPVFARYGVRNGINVYLTSNCSDEAEFYAQDEHLMLIDGNKLAHLMIAKDFCVSVEKVIEIKSIDKESFNDYMH